MESSTELNNLLEDKSDILDKIKNAERQLQEVEREIKIEKALQRPSFGDRKKANAKKFTFGGDVIKVLGEDITSEELQEILQIGLYVKRNMQKRLRKAKDDSVESHDEFFKRVFANGYKNIERVVTNNELHYWLANENNRGFELQDEIGFIFAKSILR